MLAGSLLLPVVVLVIFPDSDSVSTPGVLNVVVQTGQVVQAHWQPPAPFQLEGIEQAERINEQMMLRNQDQWKRLQELRQPLVPASLCIPGVR